MRHPIRISAVVLAMGIVACATIAHAQDEVVSNVPFAFKVGGKTFEPGRYTLSAGDEMVVTMTSPNGKSNAALVETRLAAHGPADLEGRLVFDKVGDAYYLSELWLPGKEDGFLLHATKEKHSHVNVSATRKG